MYYLKSEKTFDSAHFLKGYEGKCSNIHGHCWKVTAEIKGESLESEGSKKGMLIDFGDLKGELKEMCDYFDHCLIYETGTLKETTVKALEEENFRMVPVNFRPTAENFAKYFYTLLKEKGLPMHRVDVHETETNCASYEE